MKKLFTFLIAVLFFSCYSANAQSFNITDTIYIDAGAPVNLPDTLINNNVTGLTLNWKVVASNFPNNWLTSLGICDNSLCHYNVNGVLWPTGSVEESDSYAPGSQTGLTFLVDLSSPAAPGNYYLTVKLTNPANNSDTKNTTLFVGSFPAGIASVNNANSDIAIYPNPANNMLYAGWGNNATAIKNIEIYDIIGRKITSIPASGTKAAIQLGDILPGTYFIRFLDASGKMISTKKFIRQ